MFCPVSIRDVWLGRLVDRNQTVGDLRRSISMASNF
jgi:hypothetical protein